MNRDGSRPGIHPGMGASLEEVLHPMPGSFPLWSILHWYPNALGGNIHTVGSEEKDKIEC